MYNPDFLTPKDILYKNPEIKRVWNEQKIGYLLMLQLVRGRKLRRGCLVSETDVKKIYNSYFTTSGNGEH